MATLISQYWALVDEMYYREQLWTEKDLKRTLRGVIFAAQP